jgi:DNA repair exonuclease SbcCD ATPase subunit
MDFQQLEVLEDKIKKLISSVKVLQTENETLTKRNDEHEKTIRQLKQDLDKWSKSAEEQDSLQDQVKSLQHERDEVRGKIERLISHLEDIENKL